MGPVLTRILLILTFVSTFLFVKVLSQMIVEVEVMQFSNPNSKLKSGKCCNGREGSRGRCPLMCQTFFTACAYGPEGHSCQDVHYALLQSQVMGNSTFSSDVSLPPSPNELNPKTSLTTRPTSKFILFGKTAKSIQTGLMLDLEAWNKKTGVSLANSFLIAEFTLNVGTVGELMGQWGTPVSTEVQYPDSGPIFIKVRARLTCAEGYYGPTCSKHCIDKPLYNRVCDQNGNYICAPGYTGKMCDRFVCEEPCVHGSCNGPNTCSCNFGFQGSLCDQCIPLTGCVNGKCHKNTPYTCACHIGWGGHLCDQDLETCARLKPCQNGGHCSPDPKSEGGPGYKCKCQKGFSGVSCEVSANCDSPGYCENGGNCSEPSSVVCKCPFGWKGTRCNERIPCDSDTVPCRNGGTCEKSITSSVFRCECRHGFLGAYCQLEDPCVISAKANQSLCYNGGICDSDANGSFKCLCDNHHFGSLCEKRISDIDCEPNPCHNRGICIKQRDGELKCECGKEYSGKFCTEKKNPCSDHPCNNGASCIQKGEGSYECKCPSGFYGKICDKKIMDIYAETTKLLPITTSTAIADISTTQVMEEETTDNPVPENLLPDHKNSPNSQMAAKENIDVNLAVNIPQNNSSVTSLNIIAFVLVSLVLAGFIFLAYHILKKVRNGHEILPNCCLRKDPTSYSYPYTGSNIHQNNIGRSHHLSSYRRSRQSDDLEIGYKQKDLNNLPFKEDNQKIVNNNDSNRNFKCNNINKNFNTSAQNMYCSNRNSAVPDKWALTEISSPAAPPIFDKHFSDEQINKVPKTNNTALLHPDTSMKPLEISQRRSNFISRSLDSVSHINSNKDYKTSKV